MYVAYLRGIIIAVSIGLAGCGSGSESVELREMPDNSRVDIPVELEASSFGRSDSLFRLSAVDGPGPSAVLQRTPALFAAPDGRRALSDSAYCGVFPSTAPAGGFELESVSELEAVFSLRDQEGRLTLMEGDRPVFAYNYERQLPAGVPGEYERSSYIHPIWNLEGTVITDDFPDDHYHHRGLSWMWPRVFIDGNEYDLWALRGVEQVFDRWLARETGPACATIGVKNRWEMMDDGRSVVDEWVWVRAFPAGQYGRAMDVRITLEANEPVAIAGRETDGKGYGGFSLRFGPREGTTITSSEGPEPEDSDHKRLAWADESGRFRGAARPSGIAVFQHAGHPDFPAKWTLRHYGFIGVAWPSLQRVSLAPGEPLTLRYRLWIHRGSAAEGRVAEAYQVFAQPPIVSASR